MNSLAFNKVIRVDGSVEPIDGLPTLARIEQLIAAQALDTVNLRQGWTMYVDDAGTSKALPPNVAATALYHTVCRPGTTWEILGDVAVVRDASWTR